MPVELIVPAADVPSPTLAETREQLERLRYEVGNHGRDSDVGRMCARAYNLTAQLVYDYLFPEAD